MHSVKRTITTIGQQNLTGPALPSTCNEAVFPPKFIKSLKGDQFLLYVTGPVEKCIAIFTTRACDVCLILMFVVLFNNHIFTAMEVCNDYITTVSAGTYALYVVHVIPGSGQSSAIASTILTFFAESDIALDDITVVGCNGTNCIRHCIRHCEFMEE
ncbi:Hypothetical predicted protein [Octopus vulgaris]|uniref:Uncharacterized protein n=1 Tax=Octopus vulgaris TaxID=6645 RepID=A0AA36F7L7_OCTVU|nr:Hypothetical predicted protein [Octopus vulgaris]